MTDFEIIKLIKSIVTSGKKKNAKYAFITDESHYEVFDELFYLMQDEFGTRPNKLPLLQEKLSKFNIKLDYRARTYNIDTEKMTQKIYPAVLKIMWE